MAGQPLPDLQAGVWKHYKGGLYLVMGLAHDANIDGRTAVVYLPLQLDPTKTGARLAVRTVEDWFSWVDPATKETVPTPAGGEQQRAAWRAGHRPRFRYLGPTWDGEAAEPDLPETRG